MSDTTAVKRPRTRRKPAPAAPTTPDPVEIAMEAEASGKATDGVARKVLESQVGLIAEQTRLAGWQIAGERASFALKVLTGVVGLIAAVVVVVLLWSASQYRGLTVQPFSVPPELEARGLTGSAVATRLLDKLSAMQEDTRSGRPANTFANSWGDDLQVEIPQTGVSAGELWKFLRSWLGEEVKITGEVVRTPDGRLQVTARTGGHAAPVLAGSEAELEAMLDRAAEAIYARSQPYRYAIYLGTNGREAEARTALRALTTAADPMDRKWAYVGLGYLAPGVAETIAMATAAIEIDPTFGRPYENRSEMFDAIGKAEAAYQDLVRAERLTRRPDGYDPTEWAKSRAEAKIFMQEIVGDLAGAVAARAALENPQRGNRQGEAWDLIQLRNVGAARDRMSRARDEPYFQISDALFRPRVGLALEDWPAAAEAWAASRTMLLADPGSSESWRPVNEPRLAYALARTGKVAEAEAMLKGAPLSSYWVLIAHGQVLAIKGDVAGSERWFARATAAGPSLADADLAWGRARLDRRDWAGAIERYKVAAKRAPRWADPLKGWGDALAGQGDHKGALKKYGAAAERAPRWGKLQIAWGRSLAALGRRDEALAKWRTAAGMDLSPADRATVTTLLGGRPR